MHAQWYQSCAVCGFQSPGSQVVGPMCLGVCLYSCDLQVVSALLYTGYIVQFGRSQ